MLEVQQQIRLAPIVSKLSEEAVEQACHGMSASRTCPVCNPNINECELRQCGCAAGQGQPCWDPGSSYACIPTSASYPEEPPTRLAGP